jgi:dTDP-4-amino-4,6-dideoxygalactose transaminase
MMLCMDRIADTPSRLQKIEEQICENCRSRAVLWSGRAATALFIAYRAAVAQRPEVVRPEVILPAVSCATPANAAILAGLVPRFADVDPRSGLCTLNHIKARWTENTRAVVFIHLFGQTADLDELANWCRQKNVILIEDLAQALGATLPGGHPAGSAGDLTIFSFNPTKILESGGAALAAKSMDLLDSVNTDLKKIVEHFSSAGQLTSASLSLSYRNLHHSLVSLLRVDPHARIDTAFLSLRRRYESLLLRPFNNPEPLCRDWNLLSSILELRRAKAEEYQNRLRSTPFQILNGWQSSGVCWRFSLLLPSSHAVVPVCEAVRSEKFHVSNLYWQLPPFFRPSDQTPVAADFCQRIINLWVSQDVTIDEVRQCAESLCRNTERFNTSMTHRSLP